MIALQYHDVRVRINWGTNLNGRTFEAYAKWAHVDNVEREFFAERPHDMLITQLRYNSPSNGKVQDLVFNGPVKFLAMANPSGTNFFNANNKVKLQANGVDLEDYTWVQPNLTAITSKQSAPFSSANTSAFLLYPFCFDTSSMQPSGSLNFSRLDSATMLSQTANIQDPVYAMSYNILRIKDGMGGLLFSD